ncbi:MAG: MerR family transcriptional regulator [Crocinitomicaceae bacterium]
MKKDLTKLYYTIGEVAEMFDVKASLIRFWEKEFKGIQPKKNKKGNRLFTPSDIAILEEIYELVKVQGFTLDGARQQLKQKKKSGAINPQQEIIDRLKSVRKELKNLRDQL